MCIVFFFKQKTAYERRISDWSSDVCSSDLLGEDGLDAGQQPVRCERAVFAEAGEGLVAEQERGERRQLDVGQLTLSAACLLDVPESIDGAGRAITGHLDLDITVDPPGKGRLSVVLVPERTEVEHCRLGGHDGVTGGHTP